MHNVNSLETISHNDQLLAPRIPAQRRQIRQEGSTKTLTQMVQNTFPDICHENKFATTCIPDNIVPGLAPGVTPDGKGCCRS